MNNSKTVYVMMSGGVDSSVAASVLLEHGYSVVGVFMKCWSIESVESLGVSRDLYGCFWEEDSADAAAVASTLGIPFYVWNFEQEYKQGVVDYMLNEYRRGRTPNPDVMCNSVIKFGMFYRQAMALGADYVATGHYARTVVDVSGTVFVGRGRDSNKDQSYFLARVGSSVLPKVLFPVGEFDSKNHVREYAVSRGLLTAHKKDSQGLCFIGETPLREMLLAVLGKKEGDIVDLSGNILGRHPGAHLYTIGQRQKLGLGGGPWFVSSIDVARNRVTVAHESQQEVLFRHSVKVSDMLWYAQEDEVISSRRLVVQIRYRQEPISCTLKRAQEKNIFEIHAQTPLKAVAPGQIAVIYQDDYVMSSGIIV